jgi:hypothetical protein
MEVERPARYAGGRLCKRVLLPRRDQVRVTDYGHWYVNASRHASSEAPPILTRGRVNVLRRSRSAREFDAPTRRFGAPTGGQRRLRVGVQGLADQCKWF